MKIVTDDVKIQDVLTRGVHDVFTKEEMERQLKGGHSLTIKLGTDVTGSQLHLGHAVIHRKLRDFQELGHKVALIIGDATTLVGDHSDKLGRREKTTKQEIKKNEKTWKQQFFKTVKKAGVKFFHNSKWLNKLSIVEGSVLADCFTVQQMFDRETFKKRFEKDDPIGVGEWLYPVMQGYDSIAVKADIELGGTDQTFNLLAGRKLMKERGIKPQTALTMKLLPGSDGKPMGKSLENFIPISASANDMYGGIMAIVDDIIFDYFELITRVPMSEIEKMKQEITNGANPLQFKKRLAKEVVSFYHGEKAAQDAAEAFEEIFSKGETPSEMPEVTALSGENLSDLLVRAKVVESKSEVRRLAKGDGITNLDTGMKIKEVDVSIQSARLKIGKRRFLKINRP